VESYKKAPGGFQSELHRRLVDWMFPFVFALISLVVAGDARSHREARLHPMVAALLTAFMLRWLGFYFTNQVKQSAVFIPLVYAVPVVSGGISIFLLLTGQKLRMPRAFGNALMNIQKRFSPKASGAGGQST
jgi:lipopolysaccharide export system permease protein